MSTLAINQRIIFTDTINRNTLIVVFFLSGFAGLIYESIWTQYLKLFLGHAAYAQTLVLIIFMGGMALGAWLTSKYLHKFKNLFLAYAIVEAIVGVFALVFHNIYVASTDFAYNTIMPFLGSSGPIEIFKWSLATLLILPQTILLGSTFPLMSAGFIHYFPEKKGHSLSILYFSNSFGAAIGVLVSGFYLVRTVGLPGTLLTAGLINFAVALISWITSKQFTDESIQPAHLAKQEVVNHRTLKILLIVAAVTGAASFMYEVAWIRMLSMVLGSSVHSFELMLSAFILGLAIGGFWIRNKISKIANPIQWLGYIQIIMGILAALTITFYNYTFDFMAFTMQALQRTEPGYIYFNLISHAICLIMMLPATICAGMTLPLITYILLEKGYNERAIGWVYATNTVGSIVGVALAVQLIMPLLGLKNLIVSGSVLDILVGLALFTLLAKVSIYKKAFIILIPLILTSFDFDQLKMASGVYREGKIINNKQSKVIFYNDGKTATISVVESQSKTGKTLAIKTNGKPDASITGRKMEASLDEDTMILSAAIPMSIHTAPEQVAVVGMGSGLTSHVFLSNPNIKTVDTIEIEPAMVEGARAFNDRNNLVFTDKRSNIYTADAKTFFSSQQKKYDIIMSEPSNPWVSGVASLFTQEFYQLIKSHIKPQGLFVQWLQIYEIDTHLFLSALAALDKHFTDYNIYSSNKGDLIIIASPDNKIPSEKNNIYKIKSIKNELNRINHTSLDDIKIHHISNKRILSKIIKHKKINKNSDYYPVLQQLSDKTRYFRSSALEFFDLKLTHITKEENSKNTNINNLNIQNKYFIAKKATDQNNQSSSFRQIYNNDAFCKDNDLIEKNNNNFKKLLDRSLWLNNKIIIKHINNLQATSCNTETTINLANYYTSIVDKNHTNTIKEVQKYIKLNNSLSLSMRLSYAYALAKTGNIKEAKKESAEIKKKAPNNLVVSYIESIL